MNLKKLAEQKIDELSGKITPEQIMENAENESVEIILEGLDEITSKIDEEDSEELSIELISEDKFGEDSEENDIELSQEPQVRKIKKDLFAGYLGELSEAPNPLEYGANATYRNLREGIVYKKGPDNLWEVFVKDGAPGRQGPTAPGGGCGVTEVKNIVENRITSAPIVATYPGSPSAPFTSTAEMLAAMSSAPLRTVVWYANPCVPWGASRLWKVGSAGTVADWAPPPGEIILRRLRGATAIATVTPGVLTLTPLYASDPIPDPFLPANALLHINASAKAINAAGIAGALLGVGIMGAEPTNVNTWDYPYALTVTPTGTFSNPPGIVIGAPRVLKISADGTRFKHPALNSGSLELNLGGSFVAGSNRLYVMCKASKVDDVFSLDSVELVFDSI